MSNAPLNSMAPGWSHGARAHDKFKVFHHFKGADNISECRRSMRNSTHDTFDEVESAFKCSKCEAIIARKRATK